MRIPHACTLIALPLLLLAASAQDIDHESLEREYFAICDHDADGWISYREAKVSLQTTRAEYKVYDTNWDGRVTPEEFGARYLAVVGVTGVFPKPKPGEDLTLAITRTPAELRSAYDRDADNALDKSELRQVLADYGREELSSELLLTKLDRDLNGKLESEELKNLSRLLAGPRLNMTTMTKPDDLPKSVEELFGAPLAREESLDATPLPSRIQGPVPVFFRLDFDANGTLSIEDLRSLQSPLQLKARAGAVLATLDTNEDGTVSREEFRAALTSE